MASRPKTGGSASRRTATRKRKPATIDLEVKDTATTQPASTAETKTVGKPSAAGSATGDQISGSSAKPDTPAQSAEDTKAKPADPKPDSTGKARSSDALGQGDTAKDTGKSSPPPAAETPRRSNGIVSALTGSVLTIAGLGAIGQMDNSANLPLIGSLYGGGAGSAASGEAALDELKQEVSALSSGQVDISPVNQRIDALETQLAGIGKQDGSNSSAELAARIDSIEDQMATAGNQNDRTSSEVSTSIAALESALAQISEQVIALETAADSGESGSAATVLDEKIAAIGSRVSELRTLVEQNAEQLDNLVSQSGELQETVASVKAGEKVARSVAVNALGTALANDDSLSLPIASLEALIGESEQTKRLRALADQGIPSLGELAQQIETFSSDLAEPASPDENATLSDRFWANAQKLVSFRSSGPREGSDPLAILSRVKASVTTGNLDTAKQEWTTLPQGVQDKGAAVFQKLEIRREANALYQALSDSLSNAAG